MNPLSTPNLTMNNVGSIALPQRYRVGQKSKINSSRYALDQAAIIFPSTLGRTQHHLYNISVTLRDAVDEACLNTALEMMRHRFPAFLVRLKAGLCNYRLETLEQPPKLQQGIRHRLRPMSHKELAESCVRVQTKGRKISIDCFHAVSDGYGAMVFVKTLLAAYLSVKHGLDIPAEKGVLHPDDLPRSGEMEDSYLSHAAEGWNTGGLTNKAFKHQGTPAAGQVETAVAVDAALLHRRAKELGVTVTQYITGLLLLAANSLRPPKAPPVRIAVPVNLRSRFPSNTLRNFSLSSTVGLPDSHDLPDVLEAVKAQLCFQCSTEALAGSMAAVRRLGSILKGFAPLLGMKNAVLKLGYSLLGSQSATMAMSNLGRCDLPDVMMPYVKDISCRSDTNPADTHSCTMLTFRNRAVLRLGRSIRESALEDAFCGLLARSKLPFHRTETKFSFEA